MVKNTKKIVSPKLEDAAFSFYWREFVNDVTGRDNYKKGHLHYLIILCDLFVEYNNLSDLIKLEGYHFVIETRYGVQQKANMHVNIRKEILSEIRQYSKLLGILLTKDTPEEPVPEKSAWS